MEYRNLQDNIRKSEYNQRTKGVLNWIQENREKEEYAKDPNAYEMTNLFLLGGKYAKEGEPIEIEVLSKMWEIRSKDFERVGIGENGFVYQICQDAYKSAQSKESMVNDEASHHALRKMAGIGLYCYQQKRDNLEMKYNNPNELLELIEASRTLKSVHPNLYEKYQFDNNLKKLMELQPENNLTSKMLETM